MDADLDTLATALYVRVDDLLNSHPERRPWRPKVGIAPKISDAEVVTLSVMAGLLGHTSEARWLRYARAQLRGLFLYLPEQPGYNKRLRGLAATIAWLIGQLARDTSLWSDDVWLADSTRWSAAARGRPRNVPSWPASPSTATAPPIRATSWAFGCTRLSKSRVSILAKDLDEQVEAFRTRPLDTGPYTFVAADALVLKLREGAGSRKRTVNVHALLAVVSTPSGTARSSPCTVTSAEDGAG